MNVLFPSYSEFVERSELMKQRQECIVQARQKSMRMTTALIENAKKEAEIEFENKEQFLLKEIREQQSKELHDMRRMYADCILKVNLDHYNKLLKKSFYSPPKTRRARPMINNRIESIAKGSPIRSLTITQKPDQAKLSMQSQVSLPTLPKNKLTVSNKGTISTSIKMNHPNRYEPGSVSQSSKNCVQLMKPVVSETCDSINEKRSAGNVRIIRSQFSYKPICNSSSFISKLNKCKNPTIDAGKSDIALKDLKENLFGSYSLRVHDKIRVLEQQEKILLKRIGLLPSSQSLADRLNSELNDAKPHIQNFKAPTSLSFSMSNLRNEILPLQSDSATDSSVTHLTKANQQNCSSSKSSSEPLPLVSVNKSVTTRDSDIRRSPKVCKKRKQRCKKIINMRTGNDLTIVIKNNRSVSRNVPLQDSTTTNSTSENVSDGTPQLVSQVNNTSVPVSVNKKDQSPKSVPQTTLIGGVSMWRRQFDNNSEKLSASSYFSPPASFKRNEKSRSQKKSSKYRRYEPKNGVLTESEDTESKGEKSGLDVGYYVAKLLMMSAESLENLRNMNNDDANSTISNEILNANYDEVLFDDAAEDSENDSFDEDKYLRELLEVNLKLLNKDTNVHSAQCDESNKAFKSNLKEKNLNSAINPAQPPNVCSIPKSRTKVSDEKNNSDPLGIEGEDQEREHITLKTIAVPDKKIAGWISTSIRRTLEASAINSTSSNDESDSLRHINKIIQSFIEWKTNDSGENSSSILGASVSSL